MYRMSCVPKDMISPGSGCPLFLMRDDPFPVRSLRRRKKVHAALGDISDDFFVRFHVFWNQRQRR